MDVKKFLIWLAVVVVLFVCLIGSCLVAAFSISDDGREISGDAWRETGKIGREEENAPVPNQTYDVSFDEDGTVRFYGDGLHVTLPPGYRVKSPEGRSDEAPPFQYFLLSDDGLTQVRLRREDEVPGASFWYGGDRKLLLAHARAYAEGIAGKAAVEEARVAYVAPARLEPNGADVGIEGCYRYTGEERARQGFDGEYFVFIGRGYGNVILVSVAFKPFAREEALAQGRKLADTLRFN
jgi:hypothetical protein